MRIAIFSEVFLPKIDGITNRLRHTVEWLVRHGHEVRVFAPDTAVAEHAGARVVRLPGLPFPPYPGLRVTAPHPTIALELARWRPHVVHAVGPACLGIWGSLAARALGLPLVASYHTDFPRYLPRFGLDWAQGAIWPLIRQVHNAAHVNLCPSRFTQAELREHGVENVGIWRGGVDTELFRPERRSLDMRLRLADGRPCKPLARSEAQPSEDESGSPVLLYVGRLSPEKRLEVFEDVLERVPGVRVALVGDGPARADLERRFAGKPVHFLGFLRGEALAAAFASADLFLMPSTTETLGFVVLEALASGLPVVAARAGGIPDLVRDGENGLLYDPAQPEQAAQRVAEILGHPGKHRFYAQQARKSAEGASWERETRLLEDHYRRAIVIACRKSLLGRVRHALFV